MSVYAIAPRTLADMIRLPHLSSLTSDCLKIVAGVCLVAALSQVSIPLAFTPVPLTGQTLGVLLCAISLGARRGTLALFLYLFCGAVGLPVFAGGGQGMAHLFGPTAGYLWGFPLTAFLAGWLAEKGWDRHPLTAALCMIICSIFLLTLGAFWLSFFVGGWTNGFQKGMLPFLPIEGIKIALATLLLPGLWCISEKEK